MSRNYKILDQGGVYFITLSTVGWIDVFTRKEYRDITSTWTAFAIAKKKKG